MILEIDSFVEGFKVLRHEYVEEIKADAYMLQHVKSGARLLYLGCDDDNKVFQIGFRTPPADDTGVAHITEHSVLCGSRKYHLKEPFVDLVKGSLNTFLNAMTYPDKTVYPVASRNAKDFRNLMDVYLDAVFYPDIYTNPFTLRQEGWHYNLEELEGELSYNGVVYNEMKGVYSSPDAFLEREAMQALFPDNCYKYESGGLPEAVPQLTQAKFEQFHSTYYSAENSYIYLYGDMDIVDTLHYLDSEYLSAFTASGKVDSSIPMQKPLERTAEIRATYPIAAEETTAGKTYHELSIVVGQANDIKTQIALRLLETVLLESDASPLRRALLEAGVGNNISGSYSGSLNQPIFAVRAAGSEEDLKDKFLNVTYKTLQKLTIEGIDKKLLEASLNNMEFKLREADFGAYPKGLIYGLGLMDVWLYDGDPIRSLRYNQDIEELRAALTTNYYEQLVEQYLMDNTHRVLVTLVPEPGKEDRLHAEEAAKMAELKAGMSQEELQQHINDCEELHRRQAEPDSEEARASIPILKRTDIRREVEDFSLDEKFVDGQKVLYLPANTNKIVYTNFYFDITDIPAKLLPAAFLLVDVLGKFNTDKYTYQEIATDSIMYTGGISFATHAVSAPENADDYRIHMVMKAKCLLQNVARTYDIIEAIATGTQFKDKERLKELLLELKTDWEDGLFSRGQSIAIARIYSYCCGVARVNENDLFSYYQYLQQICTDIDAKADSIFADLEAVLKLIFNRSNYTFAYTCDEENRQEVEALCLGFVNKLPEAPKAGAAVELACGTINEAISLPGKVQYVAAGGNFGKHGHRFVGAMRVLEVILRYEYLWTKIRIQGGAYGATARFEINGLAAFASYRDPQLVKSLEAYKELPNWLRTLEIPQRELDKYVIGTISGMDTPLTNSMKLDQAVAYNMKSFPNSLRQRIRDEVLDITNADLQALAQVVEDCLSDGYICVVGGKQPIEENKELFNKIINA